MCSSPFSRAAAFPSTCFIRRRDQLDYLQEPDVFHDIYGHVPMLINPVFADYMQAYGEGGLKALRLGHLRASGAALLVHGRVRADRDAGGPAHLRLGHPLLGRRIDLLPRDPRPNRLRFDLRRVMRTHYHIDRYQETYFVIDDFEQLFAATRPDFAPIYREIAVLPEIAADEVLPGERVRDLGCRRRPRGKKEGPRVSTARV